MKISSRECVLGIAAVATVLFGGSIMLARPKVEEWKDLRKKQANLLWQIGEDKKLIDEKDELTKEFEEAIKMLPLLPADRKYDTYWMSRMDEVAARRNMTILKRRTGSEKKEGVIYELPITVTMKGWRGSWEAIVYFLFDLQSEGAMLDIRQLTIKPKSGAGELFEGSFTLYCAYTRMEAPPKKTATER